MYVELDTIAEISLALIGFSALLAMFRQGGIHTWEARARLAFWLIVTSGFAALFFSLLPSIMRGFVVASWAPSIALLAGYHVVSQSLFLRWHFTLNAKGESTPNPALWVIGVLVSFGSAGGLALGLAGGLGGASYPIYNVGVVACLVTASLGFIGFLRLDRPTR